MSDTWNLLDASVAERARFATAAAVLALPAAPAAPRNAAREVVRLVTPEGEYFLKRYRHTPLKHRVRNALTRPRARHDAARESAVAQAIVARGFATARVVAVGTRGAESFFLCAAIQGRALAQVLERRRGDGRLLRDAARHLGRLAASGVHLPDLSADHVFLLDGGPPWCFAVLDLTNGVLRARARPADAVRILRRLALSLADLAVPPRLQLGAALAYLRAAGLRERAGRILARLPPGATHARYQRPGRSDAYARRAPRRHAAELRLLQRVLPDLGGRLVLDSPCGAGRIGRFLATHEGARVLGADRAPAMLAGARASGWTGPLLIADAARLPVRDASVDTVVLFRFLHHLHPRRAKVVVAEAARAAGRAVVISFFHPVSAHGLARTLRTRLTGRATTRHAVTVRRLRGWFARHGFELAQLAAQAPFLRDLWVARFERGRPR
ncbi:MAG: methyltransferase domain-containing protein [Planctomycetes bacterium]|nr:methyltransferase domain-containing protein [Planctomycetota bacterium]